MRHASLSPTAAVPGVDSAGFAAPADDLTPSFLRLNAAVKL